MYKAFVVEGVPPDAHWIVKALATIIKWVHTALTAVDEFFEGFFAEASDLGGIWEATKSALVNAAAFWRHEIARFIEWLSEKFLNLPTPVRVIFGGLTGGLSELAARFGSQARSNLGIDQFGTRTPTTGPLGFLNSQLGSSPTTSPIPIRRESRSVSIQAPINLTVEAPPGADPQKVAEVTAAEIDKRMREREDEAYRQVFDEVAPRTRY